MSEASFSVVLDDFSASPQRNVAHRGARPFFSFLQTEGVFCTGLLVQKKVGDKAGIGAKIFQDR